MNKIIIDESKIIKIKPQIYIYGVFCKTQKEELLYEIIGNISIICGLIGLIGGIMMISYFYFV